MLLGAGCGNGTSFDSETDTINLDGQNGSGLSAGAGASIPANFPADFPRYPGAKTILAYTENDGKSGSLMQETSDTLAQAQTKIEELMQNQGFTKDNVLPSPSLVGLLFHKGTVKYQINIAQQAETTQIQSVRAEE